LPHRFRIAHGRKKGKLIMPDVRKATVVMAHGAWADGSSWEPVIRQLHAQRFNVVAAPIPLTSLSDDAAALGRTISRTEGPIIVAGHAYAGAVVGIANDERVNALVYIAALAPDEGETVAEVFYRNESHPKAPKLAPDADGFIWMPDESFGEAFAQNATAEQITLCRAVQRPISVKCIQERVVSPTWKTKPSWYLLAEEDRMINPKTQRFMAERMNATIRSFAVDHTPLLTAPDKVVDIIREAAHATLG
jgi:pimeloyl-ACP methyl ester carboxylesterase